jgi:plasmid stabilization system protein ParE
MIAYDFHPEARFDLDEIWEFIRGDNLDAADRLISEILDAIDALVPFPGRGHRRPDPPHGLFASFWFVNT